MDRSVPVPGRRRGSVLRRRVVALSVAVTALVGGTGFAVVVAPPAGAASADRPIALGADTKKVKGQTEQTSLLQVESEIGRKVAFTRDFLLWDDPFPTSYENWLGQRGTVAMVSVKSRLANGTAVPWASVAAAAPGSARYAQIVSWADRLRDYGYPVYFTYNHEPEAATNQDLGTPADYIAAWQHIHDIFVQEGATNVRFMWIMTDYSFNVPSTDRRYAWYWYPGDAYVDGIAEDAYNWSNCRYANGKWQTLADILTGFLRFGAQHPSVPQWLTEFASVEDPAKPNAKAQWISAVEALLQQPAYSQIVGVSYFNQLQSGSSCNWPVESSSAATAAFATMAQDPAFAGSAVPTTDPPPPPPPSSIAFDGATSTTANASAETVTVPAGAGSGDGLVLIATSATPTTLQAPAGWTQVGSATSPSMSGAVWQRVATSADPGTAVSVRFGASMKGSVELLAYSGTDASAPVASATASSIEASRTSLVTPAVSTVDGQSVLSYWAARSSVDTTLTVTGPTVRSSESGTGGGRVTSMSADAAGGSGSIAATVSPAVTHAQTWSIVLDPA